MDREQFLAAALRNPVNSAIADEPARLALPDAWLVSGCLVQTAWNVLTGRAVDYGIADYVKGSGGRSDPPVLAAAQSEPISPHPT